LFIAGLLVFAAVSGCLADPEAKGEDASPGASGDAGNTTANGTGANATSNTAPTANLTADVDNGSAPLSVNFTIEATDADGDNLTWSLDADGDGAADGNGTEVPGNLTFLFEAEGVYNATLTVEDGASNATSTLQINVTGGGASMEPVVLADSADLPCPQCSTAGANTGVGYRAGESGLDSVFFDLLPEYVGQPFAAASSGGGLGMVFRDSCDAGAAIGSAYVGGGPNAGMVPEGALCVLMWDDGAPGADLSITIGAAPA